MAKSGSIKFIMETDTQALVEETASGASYPDGHKLVKADFSAKAVGDTISYDYDAMSVTNDGHNITIS
jgi:hypothetical protein